MTSIETESQAEPAPFLLLLATSELTQIRSATFVSSR